MEQSGVSWYAPVLGACLIAGCSIDEAPDTPLVAGPGIEVAADGERRRVAIVPAEVPVVSDCVPGQVVRRAGRDRWACVGTPTASADWSELTGVPDGLADGRDSDVLATLSCEAGEVVRRDPNGGWACAAVTASSASIAWTRVTERPQAFEIDDDVLGALACRAGQAAKWSAAGNWMCGDDETRTEADVRQWAEGRPVRFAAGTTHARRPISTGPHLTTIPWSRLSGVPTGFADEADSDELDSLSCPDGRVFAADATGQWACAVDQTLDTTTLDAYLADSELATTSTVQPLESELVAARGGEADLSARLDTLRAEMERQQRRLAAFVPPAGYIRILPGSFTMGSPLDELGRYDSEWPHQVTISRPFWLKATEVNRAEWRALMGTNPSGSTCDECPVAYVSWEDAVDYVNALSAMEGLDTCYAGGAGVRVFAGLDCLGYRLPTEAEWEYAARTRTSTVPFSHGTITSTGCVTLDPTLDDVGWYCGNATTSQPVARKRPNGWGLYDMHGNLWEWVHGWYATDYYWRSPASDPLGAATGVYRLTRGGSWYDGAEHCRAARRDGYDPNRGQMMVGFRPARTSP